MQTKTSRTGRVSVTAFGGVNDIDGPGRGCQITDVNLTGVKLAICATLAVLGPACDRGPDTTTADGAAIYAKYCMTCHGSTGKPSEVMVAQLKVRDLTAPDVRATLTPERVRRQVRDGSQNKLMPAFGGVLDDAQITAVAAYVASPGFLSR
jgi:mono/diheme cytochrome c family protein